MSIIAIIGRPNVGKSTLFNRLTGMRSAIVNETSGVTRDRHYGQVEWNGKTSTLIDTGGYITDSDDLFEEAIRRQVTIAIEEADVLLLVADVQTGVTDLDHAIANIARHYNKKVVIAANKVDHNGLQYDAQEFYKLGLGEVFCVSAVSGSGTGDLLDEIFKEIPTVEEEDVVEIPRFAVVGKPNAGKSSFINALLDDERNIVTKVAGTTRDSINTEYKKYRHHFIITDTAGIRKKSKVEEDLEFYSVMRAIRAITHSDVCFLLIDATEGFGTQEMNILRLIKKHNRGVVIVVNKWDLVEKDTNTTKEYAATILEKVSPFTDVPILFISSLTKQRILKAPDMGMQVFRNKRQRIPTSKLNEILLPLIERTPPPTYKGKYIRIKYCTQLKTHNPVFAFYVNLPQYIKESYTRYLENIIREHFTFTGVPLRILFKKK